MGPGSDTGWATLRTSTLNAPFRLRGSDPGLLRARNALKAVLSVAVTLFVFRPSANPGQSLLAGISAAYLELCVADRTRRQEQFVMLASCVLMTAMTGAAAALKPLPLGQGALVVCSASCTRCGTTCLPCGLNSCSIRSGGGRRWK